MVKQKELRRTSFTKMIQNLTQMIEVKNRILVPFKTAQTAHSTISAVYAPHTNV